MRILQQNLKQTTDTFLFISHTTNLILLQFRCNIFIGVGIIIRRLMDNMKSLLICIYEYYYHSTFFINVYMVLFLLNSVIYVFLLFSLYVYV
jgi:hypothetical protein